MSKIIKHNPTYSRFELELENDLMAFISYKRQDKHLDLIHSEVPKTLRGQGIGKLLVHKTFEQIEKEGLTATAHCSFIKAVAQSSINWRNFTKHKNK